MKKVFSFIVALSLFAASSVANAQVTVSDVTSSSITLSSDEDTDVFVVFASYNDNALASASVVSQQISAGFTPIPVPSGVDKAYVWNKNMQPMSQTVFIPSNGDGIIHLNGDSIDARGVDNVSVDSTTLTICSAGSYTIEGTLSEGQIVVDENVGKKDEIELIFNNVTVENSTTAPFNAANGKISVVLSDGSTNAFTYSGTQKYSAYTTSSAPKGAFYAKRDLTVSGAGELVIIDNYKNALVTGADLKVKKNASLNVTAANNAIKAGNGVEFTAKTGTVTALSSSGDCIKTDSVDSDTGLMEADKGCVDIKGGTFNLTALAGDGIQAENSINISGGTINITSAAEGLKSNEVNVPLSVDDVATGEYANGKINISDGTIVIVAGEDGIKATEEINISGGAITVTANGTDGYDAIQVGETEKTVSGNVTTKAIVVEGTINISGGSINILGASDDAIVSNHNIFISDGTISGKSNSDFIKAYNLVDIKGGTFHIESQNDAIQSGTFLTDTVTSGTTVSSNQTLGDLYISGGDFTIKTNGGYSTQLSYNSESCKAVKGINLVMLSGGTFNINSADDALHSNYNLTVTGGTYTIHTGDDGIHADYILTLGTENAADDTHFIDILHSYEGIEGSVINILSGTQYIYSTDDGLNAAGDYAEDGSTSLQAFNGGNQWNVGPGGGMRDDSAPYGMAYIKGGKLFIEACGDGIDSNGSVEMTGGTVIVNGPTDNDNGVFDIGDSNDCYFNHIGGTLIGVGTSSMTITVNSSMGEVKSSSNQGGFRPGGWGGSSSGGNAATPIKINTDNGNIIIIPKVKWSYLYASTPDMTKNKSYTYSSVSSYSGGTQVLGKTINNVFYGLVENAD